MTFIHVKEKQTFISENHFDKPQRVDAWLNAEMVKVLTNIDGLCYARTKHALYLIDGVSTDIEELFKAGFKLPEMQKGE